MFFKKTNKLPVLLNYTFMICNYILKMNFTSWKKVIENSPIPSVKTQKERHHCPNITCEKPVIKTNTRFPPLPTKSTSSTNTTYTNNLTSTVQTPRYKYVLLENIRVAKAKENQTVSTRTLIFPSLEKQKNTSTTITTNSNKNRNYNKNNTNNSKNNCVSGWRRKSTSS